ncbi:MAG: CPBP family intramembrane metalloprotease [Firmicutes bacterium]|nr:CPBP family intramembrane metalloprotease [Bacillota bacterium]
MTETAKHTAYDKKQVAKYLQWTFVLAYILQAVAARIYNGGAPLLGQAIIAAMMFIPTLGVLLAGATLKDMGWKLRLRRNLRFILIAWFGPAILTALGAAIYFLLFPGHFDLSGGYLAANGGGEILRQMEAQGLSYPLYVLVSAIGCLTYAPLINVFLGLGEEIGWRGFLYPQLKAGFGRRKGWLLGGVIWGAWHWPLIWLIGYEYGAAAGNSLGYAGFPVSGMLLFCLITVGWGILHDWLYEKSGSIWLPALFHGAINAAATLPLSLCLTDTGSARLLGPAPMGLAAGLPFLLAATVLFLGAKGKERFSEKQN